MEVNTRCCPLEGGIVVQSFKRAATRAAQIDRGVTRCRGGLMVPVHGVPWHRYPTD
jgi:hypothetical protein